jgi:hypothetical protein
LDSILGAGGLWFFPGDQKKSDADSAASRSGGEEGKLILKRLFQTHAYLTPDFAERNDFEVSKVVT